MLCIVVYDQMTHQRDREREREREREMNVKQTRGRRIFPDNDNVSTRQKLSKNTIETGRNSKAYIYIYTVITYDKYIL